jgi:hypothetical protein
MILDHGGGPRHRCRDITRVNCRASRLPSSLNQRCALSQIQTAGPVFEIESSVGCQSHNRFVGKSQLTARVVARSHDGTLVDHVVERGPVRSVVHVHQLHVILYLRYARFVGRSGVEPIRVPADKRRDHYQSEEAKLPIHVHFGLWT